MTTMTTADAPRVSIGLPVHNGERYIGETLDSLLAQTFRDFELIICDNASRDRTEQICRSYANTDKRVRYVRNASNLGAPRNYRLAFELSSGEYFRWANCDDLFSPESLARCVEVLDREQSVVLTYPKTRLIDERGQVIRDYEENLHLQCDRASDRFQQVFRSLGLVNVIYGLMRATILRRTSLIGNFISADVLLVAELSLYGKFWEIPEFLFYRRIHPGAFSSSKTIDQLQEFINPGSKGRADLRVWCSFLANCRSVLRAPLEVSEKLILWHCLLRNAIWSRGELAKEAATALRQAVGRLLPKT
jgi:glycosyltransferase involved in cell wall biosynthesis